MTTCIICNRPNLKLRDYAFGEKPEIVTITDTVEVKNNPNYLQVNVCATDSNLLIRLKKETNKTPRQLVELAKDYRSKFPIKEVLV